MSHSWKTAYLKHALLNRAASHETKHHHTSFLAHTMRAGEGLRDGINTQHLSRYTGTTKREHPNACNIIEEKSSIVLDTVGWQMSQTSPVT